MKYKIQIDEIKVDESQSDESEFDEISTPRQDPLTNRAIFQNRNYRSSGDLEVPKRNDSKCSWVVCFMSILIVYIMFLAYGFLKEWLPFLQPLPPQLKKETSQVTDTATSDDFEKFEEPRNFTFTDEKFLDFTIGAPSLLFVSDGYFSTNSVNVDAGKRILQKMLCQCFIKSFCFNRYPAEVIEDFAAVTIIYTPNVSTNTPLLYKHTANFQSYMQSFGVSTCLLESITSQQEYVLTTPNNEPYFIQLKNDQLFYKRENLLNVAIKKLLVQTRWQIFAWIDAHQIFSNSYWWEESIIKASKEGVIQLFQDVSYATPGNKTYFGRPSYIYKLAWRQYKYQMNWTYFGNAWAITRDLYEKIGYIYDEAICGGTDYVLALSVQNNGPQLWKKLKKDDYYKTAIPWVKKVAPIFNNTVSFVRGNIHHLEHERTLNNVRAIEYIQRTYKETSLLDVLQRKEDFSLFLNDSNFKYFVTFN